MLYVMIILALSGRSVTTADFHTREACEIAATQLRKEINYVQCFSRGMPELDAEIRKYLKPRS